MGWIGLCAIIAIVFVLLYFAGQALLKFGGEFWVRVGRVEAGFRTPSATTPAPRAAAAAAPAAAPPAAAPPALQAIEYVV